MPETIDRISLKNNSDGVGDMTQEVQPVLDMFEKLSLISRTAWPHVYHMPCLVGPLTLQS